MEFGCQHSIRQDIFSAKKNLDQVSQQADMGNGMKRSHAIPQKYPFETALAVLQNLYRILDFILDLFIYAKNSWGKKSFVLSSWGFSSSVMTMNVENVEYIISTKFHNYPKCPKKISKLQSLLGNGILNADDEQWQFHRKLSHTLFNLTEFRDAIVNACNDNCSIMNNLLGNSMGATLDIHRLLHQYTFDSMAKVTFGEDVHSLTATGYTVEEDFDYCQSDISDALQNPLSIFMRYICFGWLRYRYHVWNIDRFVANMIRKRRNDLQNGVGDYPKRRWDMLSMYLYKRVIPNPQLMDKDLRDILVNFMVASKDPVAQAVSWALYHLCKNMAIQYKIRLEIESVFQKHGICFCSRDPVTHTALRDMPYLEAMCLETLRLHPTIPRVEKCAVADDVLPDGTEVRRGDRVECHLWCMGRDGDVWPNASDFVPERFLVVEPEQRPVSRRIPVFRAGPRDCVGQELALLLMKLSLARLLSKYEFYIKVDPDTITYANALTLPMKDGLPIGAFPLSGEY